MRTLYFDCFAGASGNMILGAMLGLGIGRAQLESELDKLGLPNVSLKVENVDRSGISAIHVQVLAPDQKDHRHHSDILSIIESSNLSQSVKQRSIEIFTRLADAEATVHGIAREKVHFHEVGAIDAIVDIVGACICFELLGIERFVCSKIHVGSGFVDMEHGRFPVPPPAVAELLRNVPVYSTELLGELITPTGAAIISTISEAYGPLPEVSLQSTSYGAGSRTYEKFPNVLRVMLGETEQIAKAKTDIDDLLLMETNLDDISPQVLSYVMERAFALGVLDCWFTPIQMKKNRPATMISVLCSKDKRELISGLLYSETTTLGLRIREVERECLSREIRSVATQFGPVDVKLAYYEGKLVNAMPEFEQVKKIAIEAGLPLKDVQTEVLTALKTNAFSSNA